MATGGTFYVNTASSGGDGTTNGTSGSAAAYASLALAEAGLQGTLSSPLIMLCCGGADSGNVRFDGWSTDTTNRVIVRGNPSEPDGKNNTYYFSTSYYYKTHTGQILDIRDDFITFDGIQFELAGSGNGVSMISGFAIGSGADFVFENNKIVLNRTGHSLHTWTIPANTGTWTFRCNLVDWARSDGGDQFTATIVKGDAGACVINAYNNTFGVNANNADTDDPDGFRIHSSATATVINNALFFNGGDCIDNSGTLTATHNAADQDDDSTGHQDISPGGTYSTDMNAAFTSWGTSGNDWSIKDASSVLYDNGTTGGPSTDQNGVTYTTQDIGCFAFVAGGGGGTILPQLMMNNLGASLMNGMIR